MRSDIFLHFLNRDTREIFGVYKALRDDSHLRLMRRALNAAVVLCEDRCIAPPGFVVEDQIAFDLAEAQRAYLKAGIIQFPMRENNLAEFAEKKRVGYEPMRNRYSGLFDDTRIGFLGENANGIIRRKSHITENILGDWESGPETRKRIWKPVKKILTPKQVDLITRVPVTLDQRGTALTWSAMEPELPAETRVASIEMRNALQNIYFRQYCAEFDLVVLSKVPHILQDFQLPTDPSVYNYRRLEAFLDVFDLRSTILDAPADFITELRRGKGGFIGFIDAYASLARITASEADLKFFAGQARKTIKFDWSTIPSRRARLFEMSPIEVRELDDVLHETADILVQQHGLPFRAAERSSAKRHTKKVLLMTKADPDLVLFVALEEELSVLSTHLQLDKHSGTPEASGRIGEVPVHVVCPRSMGRVAAAVAMTNYLARRSRPKLVLILGIAGGFAENGSAEGHIVSATKVVDLALRKVVDEKNGPSPNFRREDYRMNDSLQRVLESDAFDKKGWAADACEILHLEWPEDRRPSIRYGPLASSDEVVSSDRWRDLMLSGPGGEQKLLGVEMEAGGVCAAADRFRVPCCMLRAISDKADPSKADNSWRRRGIGTIAVLLERLPLDEVLEIAG